MTLGVWLPSCRHLATADIIRTTAKRADCGVEHLVLEFLAADDRELGGQMIAFAERVRPKLA
jgi:hypothetical protein